MSNKLTLDKAALWGSYRKKKNTFSLSNSKTLVERYAKRKVPMRRGVRRVGAAALMSSFIGADCGAAAGPPVQRPFAIVAVLYPCSPDVLACRDLLRARRARLRVRQLGYCGQNSNTQIKRPEALFYTHEVVETFQKFCIQLAYYVSFTAIEQGLENCLNTTDT